jgi:hypothetical protein
MRLLPVMLVVAALVAAGCGSSTSSGINSIKSEASSARTPIAEKAPSL